MFKTPVNAWFGDYNDPLAGNPVLNQAAYWNDRGF